MMDESPVPVPRKKRLLIERFTKHIYHLLPYEGGCWLWTGAKYRDGYGEFNHKGRPTAAHRWAYEHFYGAIPQGLHIDHLCRVRGCVNPWHLEAVTQAENNRRGRRLESTPTHCWQGHERTPENSYIYSSYGRRCKECKLEAVRKRRVSEAERNAAAGR